MSKQFPNFFRATLLLAVLLTVLLPVAAQQPPKSTSQKTATSTSCDGALDIVPTKAISFVRKRRPGKDTTKGAAKPAPVESKASPKPPTR